MTRRRTVGTMKIGHSNTVAPAGSSSAGRHGKRGKSTSEYCSRRSWLHWVAGLLLLGVLVTFVFFLDHTKLDRRTTAVGSVTANPPAEQQGVPLGSRELGKEETKHKTPAEQPDERRTPATIVSPRVLRNFPHDSRAFTQGLEMWYQSDGRNGHSEASPSPPLMLESTGWFGESSLRIVDVESGEVRQKTMLPPRVFGEGSTVFRDVIFMLSWKNQIGFVFDQSLQQKFTFEFPFEGWGLTKTPDGMLVHSDGSDKLRFFDAEQILSTRKAIPVREVRVFEWVRQTRHRAGAKQRASALRKAYIPQVNELEFINGYVYANVWFQDRIAVIEPSTGQIVQWLDLQHLIPAAQHPKLQDQNAVLNGVAWDERRQRLFVTGKRWPTLFEITLPRVT